MSSACPSYGSEPKRGRTPAPPVEIVFEDDDILVVAKRAGVLVHPAPGHSGESLCETLVRLRPALKGVGSAERPGVVHRLDLETSGVMVFAKTRRAYLDLRRQFETHETVRKTYLAVLHGAPHPREGTIDEPVGREHLRAVSHWRVLGRQGSLALVEFRIETGRMHQIRLHARALGCPVVGDRAHGDAAKDRRLKVPPRRQLLHAVELSFLHPVTHARVTFSVPPPADLVFVG